MLEYLCSNRISRSLSAVSLVAILSACDQGPTLTSAAGLDLGIGPQLLLDAYLFESTEGVRRVVDPPDRNDQFSNPLVTGTEDRNFQPYFSIIRDAGRFRMWYNVPIDENAEADRSHLGYLESVDGINWQRPHRVLPDPAGGIRFGASVIRKPGGGYVLAYHESGGFKVGTSADGLSWTLVQPKELIKHEHDITGITYDPVRNRYIAMVSDVRILETGGQAQGHTRTPRQSVSTDLLNWETPWDMVTPDAGDREGMQFYGVDAFLMRGGLIIGMVKVLHDNLDADDPTTPFPRGTGYTALVWSRDGRTWHRDRAAFLAPDPRRGRWDHAMSWIDEQVAVGDSVYLYYAGYETGHKGDKTVERQIGLLVIPRDRYAGWEPEGEEGTLRSRPLSTRAAGLTFNVAAAGGEMKVRVVDLAGRSLLGECEAITGDHLDAPLRCERPFSGVTEPFRLELTLRDARLYAFSTVN